MLLSALLALSLVPDAQALSCMVGPDSGFPASGAVDVPTDVVPRLIVWQEDPAIFDLHLVDELGVEVPITVEAVANPGNNHMVYLRPDAPLAAETAFSVYSGGDETDWGDWALSEFSTGSGPSEAAPEVPVILSTDRDKGRDMWGRWDWLEVLVEEGEPASYLVQIDDNEGFDSPREAEVLAWESDEAGALQVSVGVGVCGGPMAVNDDDHVRVAAVSLSGEVSAWTSAEQTGGCSSAPGAATALSALFGLIAMAGRRRG